ncbi:hypothetical protein ACFLYS_03055 [Chloroflexota bacterium]
MGIRLWLPLVIIYLPLLLLALLLLPLLLLVALLLLPWGWSRAVILLYPRMYALLCALKELEVDIQKEDEIFYISFK